MHRSTVAAGAGEAMLPLLKSTFKKLDDRAWVVCGGDGSVMGAGVLLTHSTKTSVFRKQAGSSHFTTLSTHRLCFT